MIRIRRKTGLTVKATLFSASTIQFNKQQQPILARLQAGPKYCRTMYMLHVKVHAACYVHAACLCPCCLSKSMLNIDFGTDTHICTVKYMDMNMQHGHGHAAFKWIRSMDMSLNGIAAWTVQCPCSMDMNMDKQQVPYLFMQHDHVHAASPCLYCMSMSTLHVHVHAAFHVYAACPCSCCMSNLFSPQIRKFFISPLI
jgi:hypothetical protein